MTRKKVGLALGGGAVRGLAHIGVLEILEKEGIQIDAIAGTSIGAAVGALYAKGKSSEAIKDVVLDIKWWRLAPLLDLTLLKSGFIGGRKVKELLKSIIGDVAFEDLKIPLVCVAADIMTGEEVLIDEGSVLEAVRASISIPVVFTLAKWRGRYLVDGGLVNPVPVDVLKRMGIDFIIAVNVIPPPIARAKPVVRSRAPNMINVIMQSIYINAHFLVDSCLKGADVVIEPQVTHIGIGDVQRAQEFILQGEWAAQDAIPEIKKKLAAL